MPVQAVPLPSVSEAIMPGDRSWRIKAALVAEFIEYYAPCRVCSVRAIGRPLVGLIKALGANVARKNPRSRLSKSEAGKAAASG
jgi:hypothetical protein